MGVARCPWDRAGLQGLLIAPSTGRAHAARQRDRSLLPDRARRNLAEVIRRRGPIGNVPPAEAEANHYAAGENLNMAAWLKRTCLRESRISSRS